MYEACRMLCRVVTDHNKMKPEMKKVEQISKQMEYRNNQSLDNRGHLEMEAM
jgi:hypothetical protein